MINLDQISKTLYVGTYPQNAVDIRRLKNDVGITAVLNLQSDDDFRSLRLDWPALKRDYLEYDMTMTRVPILDFDPQDLTHKIRRAVAVVDDLESGGHRLYIHCTAGVGRAPAVAIGHLAWNHGWDLDTAYRFVKQARACDPYLDAIRAAE